MSPSLTSESKNVQSCSDSLLRQSSAPQTAPGALRDTKQSDKANKDGNKKAPERFPQAMKDGTKSGWGRRDYKKGVEQNREPPFVGVLSFSSEGTPSHSASTLERFSEKAVRNLDRAFTEEKPKRLRASKSATSRSCRPAPGAPPPSPHKAKAQAIIHSPQPAYAFDADLAYHLFPTPHFGPSLLHVPERPMPCRPLSSPAVFTSSSLSDSSCMSNPPIQEDMLHQGSELAEVMWRNSAIDEPWYKAYPSYASPHSTGTWNIGDDGPLSNRLPLFGSPAASFEMATETLNVDFGEHSGQALSYFQTISGPSISVLPPGAFAHPDGQYPVAPQLMHNAYEGPSFLANEEGQINAVNIQGKALFLGAMPGEDPTSSTASEVYDF
ncbi:hypothetical protein BKA70DRAFT_1565191 [Coprinopsis sp. MPI-PUGE-AT-0042]|nr:hypothetical protein BKA70DRAFT_1565191 [Coprinopsis sp. MPI-PUGE-AT-0042]